METVKINGKSTMADAENELLFVVLVPHRDALPALEKYRQSLFANGMEGSFSFPPVCPLALLKRPLDSSELKSAAVELRRLMGDKKFVLSGGEPRPVDSAEYTGGEPRPADSAEHSGTAICNGWASSEPVFCVRFFGPALELPPLSFPADAVLQRCEKPIMAPAIIFSVDNGKLSALAAMDKNPPGITGISRAAALANLSLKTLPKDIEENGEPVYSAERTGVSEGSPPDFSSFERNCSFTWELGPLFWLPRYK